jgi:hypothetical protein
MNKSTDGVFSIFIKSAKNGTDTNTGLLQRIMRSCIKQIHYAFYAEHMPNTAQKYAD